MARAPKLKLLFLSLLSALVAYYLIQTLLALTVGGTGQLSDLPYVAIVSGIFGFLTWAYNLTRRPYAVGLVVSLTLFIAVQFIRLRTQPFQGIIFYSDVVFDFGFNLLPTTFLKMYMQLAVEGTERPVEP